jgi:serine/threonine protein kinase
LYGSFRGTHSYASPEVIQGSWYHAAPCDIWSIGIILSILLTGEQPFADRQHTLTGMFKLKRPTSEGARDLMEKLFRPDPTRRWGIEKVERHKWLRNVRRPRNLPAPPPTTGLGLGMEDAGSYRTMWDSGMPSGSQAGDMGAPPAPLDGEYKFGGLPSVVLGPSVGKQGSRTFLDKLKKRLSA